MRKCFVCGNTVGIHRHHVFGGRNRKISDEHGFIVDLCGYHHNLSNDGVHFDKQLDLYIKQYYQREYEKTHSRAEFMALIGRNYL